MVEVGKCGLRVGGGQCERCERCDGFNSGQGQSHAVTGKRRGLAQCEKNVLRQRVTTVEQALEKRLAMAKSAIRFLQNIQNYKVSLRVRPKPGPTYQGLSGDFPVNRAALPRPPVDSPAASGSCGTFPPD